MFASGTSTHLNANTDAAASPSSSRKGRLDERTAERQPSRSLLSISRLPEKLILESVVTVARRLKERDRRRVYIGANVTHLDALDLHITRHEITSAAVDAGGGVLESWKDLLNASERPSGSFRRI